MAKTARKDLSLEFLRQLDRFRLVLKRRVSSKYHGSRESSFAGSGLTFKDYKDYVPGDDFRNIDWRIYGRTGKFYVRRFEEERNATVHCIVDASASMDFGDPRKFDFAVLLGIGFAYLALKDNEKFEFSTFAESLKPVRARKGRKQLVLLMDSLRHVDVKGKSRFTESLESAKNLITHKSVIILLSDFLYSVDEIRETLSRFRHSDVLCVQVLDPIERSFAMEGDYVLRDSEEGTELRTYVTRRVSHTYQGMLDQHIAEIRNVCDQLHHHFVSVTTDMEVFDAFYEAYDALRH